ncbi:hypothetical protein B0H19DRAFT_1376843 [Mycena capillaripes]|nr:hypothetical protein B0H19DRAFT_1376843 [Mycena capillaripes]
MPPFIYCIRFDIVISANDEDPPAGFLFLCPTEDFRTGQFSFWWPECPAYWSLDPLGNERLTAEEATELGFPTFQLSTKVLPPYRGPRSALNLRAIHPWHIIYNSSFGIWTSAHRKHTQTEKSYGHQLDYALSARLQARLPAHGAFTGCAYHSQDTPRYSHCSPYIRQSIIGQRWIWACTRRKEGDWGYRTVSLERCSTHTFHTAAKTKYFQVRRRRFTGPGTDLAFAWYSLAGCLLRPM